MLGNAHVLWNIVNIIKKKIILSDKYDLLCYCRNVYIYFSFTKIRSFDSFSKRGGMWNIL